jgi:hypothetical protein
MLVAKGNTVGIGARDYSKVSRLTGVVEISGSSVGGINHPIANQSNSNRLQSAILNPSSTNNEANLVELNLNESNNVRRYSTSGNNLIPEKPQFTREHLETMQNNRKTEIGKAFKEAQLFYDIQPEPTTSYGNSLQSTQRINCNKSNTQVHYSRKASEISGGNIKNKDAKASEEETNLD